MLLSLILPLGGRAVAAVPTFDRTLAGPSLAEMYASGAEYDDDLRRVVVADSGLDRILVYEWNGTAPDGALIDQFGSHGTADGRFVTPRDVAVGGDSAIYVADAGNDRIQKFDSSGNHVWTRGGPGPCPECLNTPIGVTWDATNGVLLVASTGHDRIKAFGPTGTFLWQSPTGPTLGIDNPRDAGRGPDGRIWISDYQNHKVKAFNVTPAGTWTTTPAVTLGQTGGGTGDGQLRFPYNVDFSPDGRIAYVSDTANNRLARWQASSAAWNDPSPTWLPQFGSKCADPCPDPPADGVRIEHLRRVVVTGSGIAISVDMWGNGLKMWNAGGTVAGRIGGARAPVPGFSEAAAVAVAGNGTTYVVDSMNQRIQRFSATGSFLNVNGFRGTAAGKVNWPEGGAVAPDGRFWLADTQNDRLQRWQADLTGPVGVGGPGTAVGQFNFPRAVDVDDGGLVWVADTRNHRIQSYNPGNGTFAAFGSSGSGPGQFVEPAGIAASADAVFVADTGNDRIQKLDRNGTFIAQFTGLAGPEGLALAPDGTLWVADTQNDRVLHLSAALQNLGDTFGSSGGGNLGFFEPHSLAATGTELFVADTFNHRVQVFDLAGGGGPDTTPPNGTVSTPTQDQVFTSTPVSMSGSATDNVSVASVRVGIKDRTTALWYRSNGTWGSFQNQTTTLSSPGATTTGWTYSWTPAPGGSGNYTVQVTATDGAGNTDPTKPNVRFTIQSGGGGFAPQYDREISDPGGIAPLYPAGGATDADGDRIVADSGGSRIVRISPSGAQTVLSATGWNDPRDLEFDGGNPAATSLWVADTSDSQIVKIGTGGNVLATFGGPGTLLTPYGLSNDGTGIYVADTYNNRVVKMSKTTGAITWSQNTCGGTAFARPRDTTVGSDGHIYVADTDNNRVAELDPSAGTCLDTFGVVGGGNGQLRSPRSLTSDGEGGLWIAEGGNNRLQHVSNSGAFISKIGSFGEGNAQFRSAHCVFLDGALVAVCDTFNFRIQRFTAGGAPEILAYHSSLGGTPPANGGFNGAFDVAYAPSGQFFAVDWFNHRVQRFSSAGTFQAEFGGYGAPQGSMIFPRGAIVKSNGDVVITNSEDNRIDVFTPAGALVSSTKPTTGTALLRPHQTALTPNGDYWIADTGNNRAIRLTVAGAVVDTITGLSSPRGIAVDTAGNVYVSNTNQNRVQRYDPNGANPVTVAAAGSGNGQVTSPHGLRIADVGGGPKLLIADGGNDRIVVLNLNGTFVTSFGSSGSGPGQFESPRGVAVNPANGEIAVADFGNNRISVWTT